MSFGFKSWSFSLYFSWFFLFSWSPISCRKFPGHQFPISCFPARKCATLVRRISWIDTTLLCSVKERMKEWFNLLHSQIQYKIVSRFWEHDHCTYSIVQMIMDMFICFIYKKLKIRSPQFETFFSFQHSGWTNPHCLFWVWIWRNLFLKLI